MAEKIETIAETITAKFGGASDLSRALTEVGYAISDSQVRRWARAKSAGGCNGIIPLVYWDPLLRLAEARGIALELRDLLPEGLREFL